MSACEDRPGRVVVHVNDADGVLDAATFTQLRFWFPILGPTASLLLQTVVSPVVRRGLVAPGVWEVADLAGRLGVKPVKVWESFERLERYRCAAFASTDVVIVRRYLPEMRQVHVERLPVGLRQEMASWVVMAGVA